MMIQRDVFVSRGNCVHRVRKLIVSASEQQTTLVFLHDALGSITQWKSFPKHLIEVVGFNAVIIERQGHGLSTPLRDKRKYNYLHQEAYQVLPEILRQLKISKPILIGHSDGGTIALLFASRFKTTATITIAAHTFVEEITLEGIRQAVTMKKILLPKLQKYHGGKTETLFKAWWETWLADDFKGWNIFDALPKIQCPTLIIQGSDDEYGSIQQVKSIMDNGGGENQYYEVENGGHAPHLKSPKRVTEHIGEFLKSKI